MPDITFNGKIVVIENLNNLYVGIGDMNGNLGFINLTSNVKIQRQLPNPVKIFEIKMTSDLKIAILQ